MTKYFLIFILLICFFSSEAQNIKLRPLADTVGFAHTSQQMDSVVKRILRAQENFLKEKRKLAKVEHETVFKTVIAPHDDYTYAGYMYPLALQNIKAKTIILFGVAHKAKILNLENQLVFDSYTHWRGPYGNVKVSSLREEIISQLPKGIYQINDSMQKIEHSVEAEIPFLQYYNRHVEIVSILVPYMNFSTMDSLAKPLAGSIAAIMKKKNLKWGEDIAIVISADAVHYGDEDWGGRNFAFYGADSFGYKKAVAHEYEIMTNCFVNGLHFPNIELFTDYTVKKDNYKEYDWTWCGRYSVPMGLLTTFHLCEALKIPTLQGKILGYETSLSNKAIPVKDLGGMGTTAIATIRHWVGYTAVGFK